MKKMMKVNLSKNKIIEILSRGSYWKEVSERESSGDIYQEEIISVLGSVGIYNVLAILNNYAEVERERLNNLEGNKW